MSLRTPDPLSTFQEGLGIRPVSVLIITVLILILTLVSSLVLHLVTILVILIMALALNHKGHLAPCQELSVMKMHMF